MLKNRIVSESHEIQEKTILDYGGMISIQYYDQQIEIFSNGHKRVDKGDYDV